MMDMDDGYILWTGIWKGSCHLMAGGYLDRQLKYLTRFPALGHSKGNLNDVLGGSAYLSFPPSRHRENGGI